MKVIIDSREHDRINAGMFFYAQNNTVSVEELKTGDYLFIDNEKQVVFEYKTMSDFINSVNEGRVFNQAIKQRNQFNNHFIMIEGTDDDRKKLSNEKYHITGMSFTKAQFYGAIARLNTYTTVIQAPNQKTAFEMMELQAKKCLDDESIAKTFPKSEGNSAFRYLCYCCEGVGKKTAERIVRDLKLNNLNDILSITKKDLVEVHRVGSILADNILEQIGKDAS